MVSAASYFFRRVARAACRVRASASAGLLVGCPRRIDTALARDFSASGRGPILDCRPASFTSKLATWSGSKPSLFSSRTTARSRRCTAPPWSLVAMRTSPMSSIQCAIGFFFPLLRRIFMATSRSDWASLYFEFMRAHFARCSRASATFSCHWPQDFSWSRTVRWCRSSASSHRSCCSKMAASDETTAAIEGWSGPSFASQSMSIFRISISLSPRAPCSEKASFLFRVLKCVPATGGRNPGRCAWALEEPPVSMTCASALLIAGLIELLRYLLWGAVSTAAYCQALQPKDTRCGAPKGFHSYGPVVSRADDVPASLLHATDNTRLQGRESRPAYAGIVTVV
mmetsp:Transcript_30914/g.87503  ORF Transcript_30914/g.87503 Transcript_30914/m.87503 type:complete len:341 (-) Transcript_30914:329-1351(-)